MPDAVAIHRFRKLLIATSVMVYLLIVIGGIVRVTGSGLGCPDWPRCFGQWLPPLRADAIIEYTHRLTATLTSPLVLASAVIAWWRFRSVSLASRPLLAAVFLLGIQGLLGGVVVLLETPPDLVSLHLGIAFLIQACVLAPAVLLGHESGKEISTARLQFNSRLERLVRNTALVVFLMVLSGALVVGSSSTYACSGWPLCNGELIPRTANAQIHMFHRFMVLGASIFVALLFLRTRGEGVRGGAIARTTRLLVLLFVVQALVGALKVSLAFPTLLLGLHVALAAAVWVSTVLLFVQTGFSIQKF